MSAVFFLILLVAMFAGTVAEYFVPPIPGIAARIFLMPLVMLYGSVALPVWGMLGLALVAGGMTDLLHVQMVESEPEIGLGWSIVLFGVLGTIMSGFRPLYLRGRWELHCVICGLCTAVIPLSEYLMICVRREPVTFQFTPEIWWRIGGAGLTAMFLAPFVFFGFNYIAYLIGYDTNPVSSAER